MKRIFTAAIAAFGLAATTLSATAQDWSPPGPIKLMIAFAAGGGADTQARLIAEELENRMGWYDAFGLHSDYINCWNTNGHRVLVFQRVEQFE